MAGRMGPALDVQLSPPDPHPFVKWAGGKGSLVSEIAGRVPRRRTFRRYFEPFLGAGAFFFWVRRSFPGLECHLADSNEDLINAYRAVRDDVERVIAKLETHQMLHGREHYYAVRRAAPRESAERAARFIYLNRTCYNGLYRVNRRGVFNVPMGRYDRPRIVDRENLLAVGTTLRGVLGRGHGFRGRDGDGWVRTISCTSIRRTSRCPRPARSRVTPRPGSAAKSSDGWARLRGAQPAGRVRDSLE